MRTFRKLVKWVVIVGIVGWFFSQKPVLETTVSWLGRGMQMTELLVMRGHQRSLAEYEADIADLKRDIERLRDVAEVASTDTERQQLARELVDCRNMLTHLEGRIGSENLQMRKMTRKYEEIVERHRQQRGYSEVSLSQETAREIARLRDLVVTLERRVDELVRRTPNGQSPATAESTVSGSISKYAARIDDLAETK